MLKTHKPLSHPIHKTYSKGLEAQVFLKDVLENHIGFPLTPTTVETDTMDFDSQSYCVELKRRLKYSITDWFIQRDGLLIPAVKILRAYEEQEKGKNTRFYTYFDSDKSLWYWDFTEQDLQGVVVKIPPWHQDKQPHYYLPVGLWRQVSHTLITP